VLDRQERQTVNTLKIADVPGHEGRAGEQRCRCHNAIGGLEMILPTERPCQLGQAGFQREDHHGRKELLNLSHVFFRQPWMTQQFQFRHDRHENGHILSQNWLQEWDHRRILIQVVDNGVRIQSVHERLTLRERRLVPFLPHLRHLMRVQFAVQLLLGGLPEGEPLWSRDRAAGLPLEVGLRRRVHSRGYLHNGWMRLESTTLARVPHNVKGEGERAGYPSRHLEGASRGVKIYDHGLLQRGAPSAHLLRFPRSGFSLDFPSKSTTSFSNFDTTGNSSQIKEAIQPPKSFEKTTVFRTREPRHSRVSLHTVA